MGVVSHHVVIMPYDHARAFDRVVAAPLAISSSNVRAMEDVGISCGEWVEFSRG